MKSYALPGVSVSADSPENNCNATMSVRPNPDGSLSTVELVIAGKSHGGAEHEDIVQLQVDQFGVVTVRVQETPFVKGIVLPEF